jgi:hypothetical protein
MLLLVAFLYFQGEFRIFREHFESPPHQQRPRP